MSAGISIRSLEFRLLGPRPAAFDAARLLHDLISPAQALPLEVSCAPPAGFLGSAWALKAPPFSHQAHQIIVWLDEVREKHPQVAVVTTSASDDIHTCEVWFPKACKLTSQSTSDRVVNTSEGLLTTDLNIQVLTLFVDPVESRTLDEWFVRFETEPLIACRLASLQAWLRSHAMDVLLPSAQADAADKARL